MFFTRSPTIVLERSSHVLQSWSAFECNPSLPTADRYTEWYFIQYTYRRECGLSSRRVEIKISAATQRPEGKYLLLTYLPIGRTELERNFFLKHLKKCFHSFFFTHLPLRSDRVVPVAMVRVAVVSPAAAATGQIQIEVQRLGRLERHGLGERALEVLLQVGPAAVARQAVERAGQVLRGFLHYPSRHESRRVSRGRQNRRTRKRYRDNSERKQK